jgi:hypothetical protein
MILSKKTRHKILSTFSIVEVRKFTIKNIEETKLRFW